MNMIPSNQQYLVAAPHCRFCNSELTAYLRHVPMRRMSASAPLYYCLDCECMWHPQIYVEPDDQLRRDAEWHVTVEERNERWGTNFLNGIQHVKGATSFIEIGCGTGTLMAQARQRGMKVIGFDTNPYAPPIARERHNIEIETELWAHDTLAEKYDVVVCISTMEHVPDPQGLMREIATYCRQHNSAAYISVPFMVEREDWHYLLEEKPSTIQNPLYLVDVHINQFSRKGFETMARNEGATVVEFFPHGWIGYWLEFN